MSRRLRRIFEGKNAGVMFSNVGTKGRLEECEIWGNESVGVAFQDGADPLVSRCK